MTASLLTYSALAAGGGAFNPLIFDPAALGLTVVSFIGLLIALRIVCWKPLIDKVESREKRISDAIGNAEDDRKKAQAMLEDYQQRVANVETEIAELREKGRHEAETIRTELISKANADAEATMSKAQREIESAKNQAIEDLRREAVDIGMAIAGRVVGRSVDDTDSRRIADEVISKVGAARN